MKYCSNPIFVVLALTNPLTWVLAAAGVVLLAALLVLAAAACCFILVAAACFLLYEAAKESLVPPRRWQEPRPEEALAAVETQPDYGFDVEFELGPVCAAEVERPMVAVLPYEDMSDEELLEAARGRGLRPSRRWKRRTLLGKLARC